MHELYQLIKVSRDVYCSPVGHLFFKVWITKDDKHLNVTFANDQYTRRHGNGYIVLDLPKYMRCRIETKIVTMIDNREFQPYEIDDEGNARFGSFHYFKPKMLRWERSVLAERYNIDATNITESVGND